MNITSFVSIAVVALLIILLLKQMGSGFGIYVGLAFSLVAMLLIVPKMAEIIEFIKYISNEYSAVSENITVVIKALGIAIITEFASDSCKSAGENNMASIVEMGGKIAIITVAIPLINKLIVIIKTILG